jgi:ABC-type sugar transport system permease subunit
MPDYYHAPALTLSTLLLPAFGYLYFRFRDTRTLLWFLGFVFALASMLLRYIEWPLNMSAQTLLWMAAAGHTATLVGSALFLASLTPSRFGLGRYRVLYVIPYTIPLVIASLLFYGVFHGISPGGLWLWIFPALGAISFMVALLWGAANRAA